jgi:CarD family transcriptional regulator
MTTQQKKSSTRQGFKTGESIVYPAHGVGQIVDHRGTGSGRPQAGTVRVEFQKDKMRLKVPVAKASFDRHAQAFRARLR